MGDLIKLQKKPKFVMRINALAYPLIVVNNRPEMFGNKAEEFTAIWAYTFVKALPILNEELSFFYEYE